MSESNRDKRPTPRKRAPRTSSEGAAALAHADEEKREEQTEKRRGDVIPSPVPYDDPELGSGRGVTYEWEYWARQLQQQIDVINANGGGSGGGGGTGSVTFVYTQSPAAATWVINHPLATQPNVLVIDASGNELHAEITWSGNTVVTVTHAAPYAGTAYLRA